MRSGRKPWLAKIVIALLLNGLISNEVHAQSERHGLLDQAALSRIAQQKALAQNLSNFSIQFSDVVVVTPSIRVQRFNLTTRGTPVRVFEYIRDFAAALPLCNYHSIKVGNSRAEVQSVDASLVITCYEVH